MADTSTRLILVNEQNTGSPAGNFSLDCPYFDNIPVPITFQISEIRDINSAINGSYSKAINLPGSPEVNLFFENIYDINVSLSKYNPNLKVKAYYYVDEILNFEGHLQILGIEQDETNGNVIYKCNIIGEVVTLFTKIKNLYLTDIDLTACPTISGPVNYSQPVSQASLVASWGAATGVGLGYHGFIDWGVNNSNMSFVKPEHLRMCVFARLYLYAIFSAAGYTWTSTFLDSTFFKKLVIPPTEPPVRSDTLLANSKFHAQANGSQTFSKTLTLTGSQLSYSETTKTDIAFQTETYDTGNIFATPSFTPPLTAKHNVAVNVGMAFVITRNAVDISASCGGLSGFINYYLINASNVVIATGQLVVSQIAQGLGSYNVAIALNDVFLFSTTSYKVVVTFTNPTFFTLVGGAATYLLNTTLSSGSNYAAELTYNTLVEGDTLNPNTLIPLNIKQSEFVSWIFKKFNLQCTPDKAIPNNLLIEPEPTFRQSTPRIWEHDTGSKVEIIPLGDLNYDKLVFKDKEDGDYYNKLYQDEFKESYGIHRKDITNDFIKNENVYESGFSATPYVVNPNFPAVLPQILSKTNAVITPCKPNIRLLYVGGNVALPNSQWTLVYNNGGSQTVYSTIPAVGMTDNPYAPTLELAWGQVKKIYAPQGILPQTWTTNNNYNKYYSQWVNRVSDKNSKIVKGRFKLTPHDIAIFDPRYPIFTVINGEQGYYIVNKIEDYNPLVEETTLCELLKLTDYAVFVPGTYSIVKIGGENMGGQ